MVAEATRSLAAGERSRTPARAEAVAVSRLVGARDIPAERSSASAAALALQATLDAAVKVVLVLPTAGDAEEALGQHGVIC